MSGWKEQSSTSMTPRRSSLLFSHRCLNLSSSSSALIMRICTPRDTHSQWLECSLSCDDVGTMYNVTYLVLSTQFTYQPFVNQEANRQNSERRHNHEYPVNEMLVDVQCLVALFKVVHILKRHKMHSFRIRKNASPSVRAHIQLSLFCTEAHQLRHSSKNLRNTRDPFILPQ